MHISESIAAGIEVRVRRSACRRLRDPHMGSLDGYMSYPEGHRTMVRITLVESIDRVQQSRGPRRSERLRHVFYIRCIRWSSEHKETQSSL